MPTRTPNVTVNPLSPPAMPGAPEGAFGEGLAQGAGHLAGNLGQIAEEQQNRQETSDYLGAVGELQQSVEARVFDPETGALRYQGDEAADAGRIALQDLEKDAARITSGLGRKAATLFQRTWTERRGETARTLTGHVATEKEKVGRAKYEAALEGERNRAADHYTELDVVGQAIDSTVLATQAELARRGIRDPDVAETVIREQVSGVHMQVLRRYLDTGQAIAASEYLAHNRDEMTPEDASKIDAATKPQADKQRALAKANAIYSEAGGDYEKAQDLLREKYADDPLATEIGENLDERYSRENAEDKAKSNGLMKEAWPSFKLDYRTSAIPADLMRRIDEHDPELGNQLRQLDASRRSQERAAREDYLRIGKLELEKAGLESYAIALGEAFQDPQTFVHRNLVTEFPAMDREHMDKLLTHQDKLRDELAGGVKGTITPETRLVHAAEEAGIIPRAKERRKWNDAQAESFGRLEQEVDSWVRSYAGEHGRQPNDTELDLEIRALTTKVRIRGGWSFLPSPLRSSVFSDALPLATLTPEQARRAFVPINEIPKREQEALANLLKSQRENQARRTGGKAEPLTHEDIEDAYGAAQIGTRPDLAAALTALEAPAGSDPKADRAKTRQLVRRMFVTRGRWPSEGQINRAVDAATQGKGDLLRQILTER